MATEEGVITNTAQSYCSPSHLIGLLMCIMCARGASLAQCFGGGSGGAAQASANASAQASGPAGGGVAAGNIAGVHQVVNVSNSEVEELKKKLKQRDAQIARLLRAMAAQKKQLDAQAKQMQALQNTMNAILLSLGQPPVVVVQDKGKAQPDDVVVGDDVLEEDVQEEDELNEDDDDDVNIPGL